MLQYCAYEASGRFHIYVPKSEDDFVRTGRDGNTITFKLLKTGAILLYSLDNCKQIG